MTLIWLVTLTVAVFILTGFLGVALKIGSKVCLWIAEEEERRG